MRRIHPGWSRGLLTLFAAGLVAAGIITSQVAAAPKLATKRSLKRLSADVIHHPVYYRQSASIQVPDGGFNDGFVACPPGTAVIGGGAEPGLDSPSNYNNAELEASHPSTGIGLNVGTTGWSVGMDADGSGFTFRVYAICVEADRDQNFAEGSSSE